MARLQTVYIIQVLMGQDKIFIKIYYYVQRGEVYICVDYGSVLHVPCEMRRQLKLTCQTILDFIFTYDKYFPMNIPRFFHYFASFVINI